ncbi:MAG: prepilin-type N-terminal cleavage/methylation domain-containing protein [Anaerovoracaceae bacterium]|jgi:prepilin-type N-terminal cleavage/methylation domain-containing protein|nr:prepilin-type N-terminal cleavage/methylation domain-containing protein [Anaerovoracaceae bacterium]
MKTKKGFTLVEIIVALAIFAIIIGGSASLILSGSDIFKKQADMSHGSVMARYTINWFEDNITYSPNIQIVDNSLTVPAGMTAIRIQNSGDKEGQLMMYMNGTWEEVLTPGFYEGSKIDIKPVINSESLEITVEIRNPNDNLIAKSTKLINLLNYESVLDSRNNPNSPYPMLLLSQVPGTPDPEDPDPEPEIPENTSTNFYLGENPNYQGISSGTIPEYFQENYVPQSGGIHLPTDKVYYYPGGSAPNTGLPLDPGYYVIRDWTYINDFWTETMIYEKLLGIQKLKNGEPEFTTTLLTYWPDDPFYVTYPVWQSIPYGQKINIDMDPTNLPSPSVNSKPGDIKYHNNRFSVFFPRPNRWTYDFLDDNLWIRIDVNILN